MMDDIISILLPISLIILPVAMVIFLFKESSNSNQSRLSSDLKEFKDACSDITDSMDTFLKECDKIPDNISDTITPKINDYIRERAEYYFNEMMKAELKMEPVVNGTELSLEDVVFDNPEQEFATPDIVEVPAAPGVDFRDLEKSAFIEKLLKVKDYRDRFLSEVIRVPVKESRTIRISNRNADLIQRLVYHTEIPITVVEVLNNILNEHFQRNSEEVTHIIEDMPEYHLYDFES